MDNKPGLTILNDTDAGGVHFGCSRVMENIKTLSEQNGLMICNTVPAATPLLSPYMRRAISDADIVMINGEGTLHHGRRRARWLIDAIEYAKSKNKSVALVNALYQDNPDLWDPIVSELDLIYAREQRGQVWFSAISSEIPGTGNSQEIPVTVYLTHQLHNTDCESRESSVSGGRGDFSTGA